MKGNLNELEYIMKRREGTGGVLGEARGQRIFPEGKMQSHGERIDK